jgi:hypothetical protein
MLGEMGRPSKPRSFDFILSAQESTEILITLISEHISRIWDLEMNLCCSLTLTIEKLFDSCHSTVVHYFP